MDCLDQLLLIVTLCSLVNFGENYLNCRERSYGHSLSPQTNGQMKVVNRCLVTYLRAFTGDYPNKLFAALPWAEYW